MKIDCVITACNLNQMYVDFIKYFISAWKIILDNVDIKIILIAEKIPDLLLDVKENIILFPPIENISDVFISQYIRLLYPVILNYQNGVLISDIDMIPMNSKYYINNISHLPDNSFVSYRDESMKKYLQIPMCYCIASSKTWGEIFNIKNIKDIENRLINKSSTNWCKDQLDLYIYVNKFKEKYPDRTFILTDRITGFNRLNRSDFFSLNSIIKNKIKNKKYTDYHVYRPYYKYILMNNEILDILKHSQCNDSYF